MSAGFYVERGFGRQVSDLVPEHLVMQPSWFWTRFRNEVFGGLADTTLRSLLDRTQQSVTLTLDLYRFDRAPVAGDYPGLGADENSLSAAEPDDHLAYTVRDQSLMLSLAEGAENELVPLSQAGYLRDLVVQIEGMPDLPWFWIDVRIGVRLAYGQDGADNWDAAQVWDRTLSPWLHWVH
jgi:hypothetical protein